MAIGRHATGILIVGALVAMSPLWAPTQRSTAGVRPAAGEKEAFNDVAATSPGNAWIVGSTATVPVHTLIVHWNGRSWQRVPSPNAAGRRTSSFLDAVAASSRRNAWAVGESNVRNISTLIEHWNGKAWKVVPSPSPNSRRDSSNLAGVAVRTVRDAWAVGSVTVEPGSNSLTLIEHWNGTAWQRVPSPSVTNAPSGIQVQNDLSDVTVISPSNVWAVGHYIIGADSAQTLIEHWDGTKWSIVPSPDPQGTFSPTFLNGIATISRTDIFAVGAAGDVFAPTQTTVIRWNGTKWQAVPSPSSDTAVEGLTDVAAVSASDAWAVGDYQSQTSSKNVTLILHWNGRKWQAARAPVPRGGDSLGSVAAVSAKSAWAVGTGSGGGPLLMRWNGARWTIVAVHLAQVR